MLSVVSWNTDASGSWTDPTKWSTGQVPAAGDDVVIDRPGANPTVTLTGVGETAYHTVTITDTLELSGGKLITTADSQIGGRLILDGGTIQVNAGVLTLTGTTDWTAGEIAGGGPVVNAAMMTISGASPKDVGGAGLANTGTIDLVGGAAFGLGNNYGGGMLDNRAGGLIDLRGDVDIRDYPGGTIRNAGTLRKSAGTASTIAAGNPLANTGGTIDVRSGTLVVPLGGASGGGTFDVAAGATLDVRATGSATLAGTYTGAGGGAVLLDVGAGNVNADGTTLNFPAGMLRWTSGTVFGTFTNAGSMTVTGASQGKVVGGTLINTGTLVVDPTVDAFWVGTEYGPATLDNRVGGVVEFQVPVFNLTSYSGPGPFNFRNEGTVRIDGSSDPRISLSFANTGSLVLQAGAGATVNIGDGDTLPSGTYDVGAGATLNFVNLSSLRENDATVLLRGAGVSVPSLSGLSLNKGTLEVGPGLKPAISGDLTNAGTLAIDAGGELDVAGSFAQRAAARLTTQLGTVGGTASAGLVKVSGSAALDGTLNVTQAAGIVLAPGQVFTPLTFASATGAFAHLAGLVSRRAPVIQVATTPDSVTLETGTPADLAVTSVTAPSGPIAVGSAVTVSFTVKDLGAATAAGSWDDAVYLSPDGTVSPDAILLGRATHTGDVAANGTYNGTLTTPLPAVAARAYHVVVLADSAGRVADLDRANNLGSAAGTIAAVVPTLALDGPPISGTIAPGQERLYRLDVPAGTTVQLTLSDAAELLARYADLPTDSANDGIAADPSSGGQSLTLASGRGGPVYLLVRGPVSGGAGPFTLSASAVPFNALSLSPNSGPQKGDTVITIHGAGFSPRTTAALIRAGERIPASEVFYEDNATIDATFHLDEPAFAVFDVEVDDAGRASTLARAFSTFATSVDNDPGNPAAGDPYIDPDADFVAETVMGYSDAQFFHTGYLSKVAYTITAPAATRVGHDTPLTITYTNETAEAIPAPLFEVSQFAASFYLPGAEGQASGGSILLLGINQTGPAGWLPPHYSGRMTVMAHVPDAFAHTQLDFSLYPIIDSTTLLLRSGGVLYSGGVDGFNLGISSPPLDDTFYAAMGLAAPLSDTQALIKDNLTASVGTTIKSLEAALGRDATYLASIGRRTADVGTLLAFEKSRATAFGSLDAMSQLGSLGYGRFTVDDLRATRTSGTGPVLLRLGARTLEFDPAGDGSYSSPAVPGATLTVGSDGSISLRDRSGAMVSFNPDGTYHSTTQPDGTAITAAYGGGHITTLTDAFGHAITSTFDANGRITQLTDPSGRVTAFGYDPTDTLLTSVTDASGTTRYQYGTVDGTNGGQATVLAAVIDPAGVKTSYAYDDRGRLIRTDFGGLEPTTLSYSDADPGTVAVTDADGTTTRYLLDASGNVAGLVDAGGHRALATVDAHGNITGFTDPDGNVTTATYDAAGNLLSLIDPLGGRSDFSYDPAFARLTGFTDPLGNLTTYGVNDKGQTIRTTYADGSTQTFAYDASGLVAAATARDGRTTTYTYAPSSTDITGIAYGDGTRATYTYDAHHNLLTATNAQGTTTFTYDAADRVTSVSYPNGLSLQYTYDPGGRLSRMVDQSGYAVNYGYDAAGRLASLSDGSGHVITSYAYDPAGRLSRVDQANGTSTRTTYDADGRIAEVDNLAVDGSTLSKFAYTYDAAGNPLTMTTLAGTTTDTYDADGQLIRAVLPGGRTLTYTYDAAGNRVSATDGGTTTAYTTNDLNEYTAAGATTYRYDANGNLVSRTDATGTTTYTYDADGHLTKVVSPTAGTFQYLYDALGDRIATIHDGVRTDELFDPSGGGRLVGQFSGTTPLDRYVYGLGLAAQIDPSGRAKAYSFDAMGNTAALTGPTGAVLDQYTYLPFGGIAGSTGTANNPFTFVGAFGVIGDGNGLAWMRNRDYDPATGHFTRPDPLGLAGGLNAYAYVGNDPTRYVDPQGTQQIPPVPPVPIPNPTPPPQPPPPPEPPSPPPPPPPPPPPGDPGDRFTPSEELEEEENLKDRLDKLKDTFQKAAPYLLGALVVVAFVLAPPPLKIAFIPLIVAPNASAKTRTEERTSNDPNDIAGPAGYGPQAYVAADQALLYTVLFENQPTASAAAATVTITEALSPGLDWGTFQLGTIQFGAIDVTVPAGLSSFRTQVDARATLGVLVDVDAALDPKTGVVTWTLRALDPTTLDTPADPSLGLLPPDDADGRGEGSVSYTIRPRAGDATGTTLAASASIVFDVNAPIATPTASNTIDAAGPTATIHPLPSVVAPNFDVFWGGADDPGGAGLATYDVYESIDGGPFVLLLAGTTATSYAVQGDAGHTYGFAVVATDHVGHRGTRPASAQATTAVVSPSPAVTLAPAGPIAAGATFTGSGSFGDILPGPYSATVDYGDGTGASPLTLRPDGTFALAHAYARAGTYTLTVTVTDPSGASARRTLSIAVTAPRPVSGYGPDRDAFVITLYRELLGRLPTQAELVAAASKLKKAASYRALLEKLTRSAEYRRAKRHHRGTGIAPAQAYRDAIASRGARGAG